MKQSTTSGRRANLFLGSLARRAAGAPLRTIQATLQAEHGERVSLDALSRVVRIGATAGMARLGEAASPIGRALEDGPRIGASVEANTIGKTVVGHGSE